MHIDNLKQEMSRKMMFMCNTPKLFQSPGAAYIYFDIVEHQYVGNTKAHFLRMVHFPIDSNVITFPNVYYVLISKAQFGSVRV